MITVIQPQKYPHLMQYKSKDSFSVYLPFSSSCFCKSSPFSRILLRIHTHPAQPKPNFFFLPLCSLPLSGAMSLLFWEYVVHTARTYTIYSVFHWIPPSFVTRNPKIEAMCIRKTLMLKMIAFIAEYESTRLGESKETHCTICISQGKWVGKEEEPLAFFAPSSVCLYAASLSNEKKN